MTTYLSMPATHTAENIIRDVAQGLWLTLWKWQSTGLRLSLISLRSLAHNWFLPHKVRVPDLIPALGARDLALRWEGRPMSTSWMAVEEHWATEYVMQVVSEENGIPVGSCVPKVNGVVVEPYVRVREYIMDTVDLCMKKRTGESTKQNGGVRTRRTHLPTPSSDLGLQRRNHAQAMQSWASTRILEVVDLDRCVIKNLVRTEMRTTTAVLNARSSQQVRRAVRAALHRNGYRELVLKLDKLIEKGDEEELRPRERSRSMPREHVPPSWQRREAEPLPAGQPQDHGQAQPSHPPPP